VEGAVGSAIQNLRQFFKDETAEMKADNNDPKVSH
jgi:hypothetical protein